LWELPKDSSGREAGSYLDGVETSLSAFFVSAIHAVDLSGGRISRRPEAGEATKE